MDALGIDLGAFLWYAVNFGLLLFLLQRFLYRPLLGVMERRQAVIRESMENAEQVKQQLARAQQDYEARLAEARQEAARIIAQANERAQVSAKEIIAQAQAEAERIRQEAQQQAEAEREQMLRSLQTQISNLVIQAASAVVGHELKRNGHDQLIQQAIADLGRL
ncbi:F0F1 ATP synthase subunit B [Kallotenue papyrolyticum]|uniref:F0F1 ATP synthase subunit B n=1 Tax=Kallotenue papyrolyticum TaxID=1325125 RepID=UPI0004785C36|nr:F0F1 ATP synthase subunit B [Kallotenue papyrolyticum]